MTNERNSLKAGLFIVISIALIISVVVGIKGIGQFLDPLQQATVTFKLQDDIGGLSRGDEVRVGGAKVGVVKEIEVLPGPDGQDIIAVHVSIPKRFDIHKNATVAVQSTLTGVSWLNFTSLGSGELLAGANIPGRPSAMTELFNAVPQIKELVSEAKTQTLPKINGTLDVFKQTGEELKAGIKPTLDKYQAVADTGKDALANIRDVFGDTKDDFRTTMRNISLATGTVKDRLPVIVDKIDGFLGKMTTAIDSTNAVLEDVKQVASNTKDVSQTVRSLIVSNRGKLEAMIASLRNTGKNLEYASAEVRRSPWRLLYTPKPGEVANMNLYDSARQFSDGAGQLSDASIALRDALKDPDVDPTHVQKLIEKLDQTFQHFNEVEDSLWKQVKP